MSRPPDMIITGMGNDGFLAAAAIPEDSRQSINIIGSLAAGLARIGQG